MSRDLLQRALDAEDELEKLRERVADLEGRLRSALRADPTTASRALSWIGRAEQAEGLVLEILRYVKQRSLTPTELPPGWTVRAESQMRTVEILQRDQSEMAERPEDGDYWTTYVDSLGRRGVVKDDDGWMHRA